MNEPICSACGYPTFDDGTGCECPPLDHAMICTDTHTGQIITEAVYVTLGRAYTADDLEGDAGPTWLEQPDGSWLPATPVVDAGSMAAWADRWTLELVSDS